MYVHAFLGRATKEFYSGGALYVGGEEAKRAASTDVSPRIDFIVDVRRERWYDEVPNKLHMGFPLDACCAFTDPMPEAEQMGYFDEMLENLAQGRHILIVCDDGAVRTMLVLGP